LLKVSIKIGVLELAEKGQVIRTPQDIVKDIFVLELPEESGIRKWVGSFWLNLGSITEIHG